MNNKEICFKELEELMEKGEAPDYINYKGIVYEYQLKHCSKEERIEDIKKYGLWNNGGYVSNSKMGDVEFLLDNISQSNFKSKITIMDKVLIDELQKLLNDNNMTCNYKKEKDRLNNIINELEKWLHENAEKYTYSSIIFGVVENHLKELMEDKK